MTREDRPLGERRAPPRARRRRAAPRSPPRGVPRRRAGGRGPAARAATSLDAAPLEQLQQVLAKARVAAQHAPVRRPDDRQVRGAQRREPRGRRRRCPSASARAAVTSSSTDVVDEEVAVGRASWLEDVRGEVAVQRIGLAARAGHVLARAPGLEQHAGHPAAGRLDGRRRVDVRRARCGERLGRLGRGERQRRSRRAPRPRRSRGCRGASGSARRLIRTTRSPGGA